MTTKKKLTKEKGKKHAGGRPPFFVNPEDMQAGIDKYFKECKENKVPTTIPGLAYALGFEDRQSLLDYKGKPEFSCTIKKARLRIEIERNEMLLTEGNAAGKIFDLKNNFGWIDQTDVEAGDNIMGILAEIAGNSG